MKYQKRIALLLCVALLAGLFPIPSYAASGNPFVDVKTSDWFYDGVQYAYDHAMMNGTGNGRFSPGQTTTRGMIVTVLHRLEGTPYYNGDTFRDVSGSEWYSSAVYWAASAGIVDGYENGCFGPEDSITREQLAAILYRYADHKGYDVSSGSNLNRFSDISRASYYAIASLSWANAVGLIEGTGDFLLSPNGTATRAQVAVILMRFCRLNPSESELDWLDLDSVCSPDPRSIQYDSSESIYYVNDVILAYFADNATNQEIESAVESISGEVVGRISTFNLYEIRVTPSSLDSLRGMASSFMNSNPSVLYATCNSGLENVAAAAVVPNDPWGGDTGNNDWTDQTVGGSNWWAEAIEAQYAWDHNDQMSHIDIGICDTPFDTEHVELKNKVRFVNDEASKWNTNGLSNRHGTHVAGIIGANADNGTGITGLVQNSTLLLAPSLTVNKENGKEIMLTSTVLENYRNLAVSGAKIINFSLGCSQELPDSAVYSKEVIQSSASTFAIATGALLDKGYDFIVVQSAGNGNENHVPVDAMQNLLFSSITKQTLYLRIHHSDGSTNPDINEVLDRIIIVGAAEQAGDTYRCTFFSNYGDQVTICAPGLNVYSSLPGNSAGFESGTSMAAPIVAGVCAMVWSTDPTMTGAEVKEIVCTNTNTDVQPHPDSGSSKPYRMVNARLAVEAALKRKQAKESPPVLTIDDFLGSYMGMDPDQYQPGYSNPELMDLSYDAEGQLTGYSRMAFETLGTTAHYPYTGYEIDGNRIVLHYEEIVSYYGTEHNPGTHVFTYMDGNLLETGQNGYEHMWYRVE